VAASAFCASRPLCLVASFGGEDRDAAMHAQQAWESWLDTSAHPLLPVIRVQQHDANTHGCFWLAFVHYGGPRRTLSCRETATVSRMTSWLSEQAVPPEGVVSWWTAHEAMDSLSSRTPSNVSDVIVLVPAGRHWSQQSAGEDVALSPEPALRELAIVHSAVRLALSVRSRVLVRFVDAGMFEDAIWLDEAESYFRSDQVEEMSDAKSLGARSSQRMNDR
jgi:hypothetical protein